MGRRFAPRTGAARHKVKRKALERIEAAADSAAAKLIEFMNSSKLPYAVRLQAVRDLLDRAGLSKGSEVKVALRFEEGIEGLLVDIVPRDDIVDAELVEDAPEEPPYLPANPRRTYRSPQ